MSSVPRSIVYALRVLDVGASIDLDRAAQRLAGKATRGAATLRGPEKPGAGGVLLSRSPVDVDGGSLRVGDLEVSSRVRLFDFGVVSVRFTLDVEGVDAHGLVALATLIEDDAGFDDEARRVWAAVAADVGDALVPGATVSMIEDYTVLVVPRPLDAETSARILLGEDSPRALSPASIEEIGKRAIRYFADDEVMVEYDAAIVVDPSCSSELVDIFEVASAHLLELRYYDALLSRAYKMITEAARGRKLRFAVSSPFSGLEERAVLLVLELAELTDSFEHAITLRGDAYSVQVYRAAADRFRIPESAGIVRAKLEMVSRAAEVLNDHVQTGRAFVLELLVVLLIALEIALAIWRH